jgi:hypothetical protein
MPSTRTGHRARGGRLVSVPVSVHQPAPDRTLTVWLDLAPDLSCTNSIQDYSVDVDHQPTDLAVGGSDQPIERAWKPSRRPQETIL